LVFNMYHTFASEHHDFLQTEPKKTKKTEDSPEHKDQGETKNYGGYSPQGLDIVKSGHTLKKNEKGTPINEFVAPQQLIDSVCAWPNKKVLKQPKRWNVDTIKEYHKIFPETCHTLKKRCYFQSVVPNPQKYIEYCDGLADLKVPRIGVINPRNKLMTYNERDTIFYSFEDKEGFSTVYRSGSGSYNIPNRITATKQLGVEWAKEQRFAGLLPTLQPLLDHIYQHFGEQPNHCIITRYNRTYDGIGPHADKTKDLVRGSSVFIYTFGAGKDFRIVPNRQMGNGRTAPSRKGNLTPSSGSLVLTPASGSLIYMPWDMNQIFEHEVVFGATKPPTTDAKFQAERETTKEYHVEPRYSITFRSKCTWYNKETTETFVDPQWQLSSLQEGGAVRVILGKGDSKQFSNSEGHHFLNSEDKYDSMTLKKLKETGHELQLRVNGDKRLRKTWVQALRLHASFHDESSDADSDISEESSDEDSDIFEESSDEDSDIFEESSDEDSDIFEDVSRRLSNLNVHSKKVYNQKDNLIHNVQELRERVDNIRRGWFVGESKRQNEGYSPTEHDKIKFNINLYLGQCLQFFVDDPKTTTAIVLDSEDLGTSATLAAFGLQPRHIYVPNYWDGGSEYVSMKEHLPELGCFPISLEGFISALGDSTNTANFRTRLNDKYKATKYYHRIQTEPTMGRLFTTPEDYTKYNKRVNSTLKESDVKFLKAELKKRQLPTTTKQDDRQDELQKRLKKAVRVNSTRSPIQAPKLDKYLPTYVKYLDFAYLDYCGKFMNTGEKSTNNSETVDSMFQKEMFPRDSGFVLAITGSLFRNEKLKYNNELRTYQDAVIASAENYGYNIRQDQVFVYRRSHQEGRVEESLAHKDENVDIIPEDVHYKKQSHASTMFFMSFIGNVPSEKMDEWDELFDQKCEGGQCKLQFGHKECLYQRGKDRLHLSKPFCNYRVTDWYFVEPHLQNNENGIDNFAAILDKFAAVPMLKKDRQQDSTLLWLWNTNSKYQRLSPNIYRQINVSDDSISELVDMTSVIEQVRQARNGLNPDGFQLLSHGRTFELDSVHEIHDGNNLSGKVSIEGIFKDVVGLHFVESEHVHITGIADIDKSAFLVQIDDFVQMLKGDKVGKPKKKKTKSSREFKPETMTEEQSEDEQPSDKYDSFPLNKATTRRKGTRTRRQAKPKTFQDIGRK